MMGRQGADPLSCLSVLIEKNYSLDLRTMPV